MRSGIVLRPRGWGPEAFYRSVTTIPPRKVCAKTGIELPGPSHSGTEEAWLAVGQALSLMVFGAERTKLLAKRAMNKVIAHAVYGTELEVNGVRGHVHWTTLVAAATFGAQLGVDVFTTFNVAGRLREALDEVWQGNPTARNRFAAEPAFGDLLGCRLFLARDGMAIRAAGLEAEEFFRGSLFVTRTDARRRFGYYRDVQVGHNTEGNGYLVELFRNCKFAERLLDADTLLRRELMEELTPMLNGSISGDVGRARELYRQLLQKDLSAFRETN